jgi:hypothetical protein
MFVGMEWAKPSLKYSGARQLGAHFWDPKGDMGAACLAQGEAEAAFSSDDIVGA